MIVLGIDAALCNFGIAVVDLRPDHEVIVETKVVRTEPSRRKRDRTVRDDARRVALIVDELAAVVAQHRPVAFAVEATGAGKGSKAVRSMALVFGAVVTAARLYGIPLAQATPLAVKLALCGRKDAEKDDMILAAELRYPGVEWPSPAGIIEHAADAIGVVVACLDSDALRLARRMSEAA